jgi:hypothetical protein
VFVNCVEQKENWPRSFDDYVRDAGCFPNVTKETTAFQPCAALISIKGKTGLCCVVLCCVVLCCAVLCCVVLCCVVLCCVVLCCVCYGMFCYVSAMKSYPKKVNTVIMRSGILISRGPRVHRYVDNTIKRNNNNNNNNNNNLAI